LAWNYIPVYNKLNHITTTPAFSANRETIALGNPILSGYRLSLVLILKGHAGE